ncbi:MAG: glycosyltransferase [Bacteroidetes bacterium HGW-Bacteroidetes-17]|jgi:glycosyltransferase involved in cell wall biosynthesis|nr:MAG: glycosyltransferase [Bacteroidetes bacterium HGW-Bacteroidetes-17]
MASLKFWDAIPSFHLDFLLLRQLADYKKLVSRINLKLACQTQGMKKIIVSVINDLVSDQRVHRSCQTLHEMGFEVILVGRHKSNSLRLTPRDYKTHQMRLLFEKGPFFYAEYNLRLFILLLFRSADVLFSNDLDTLLPNFIIHKLKRIPIVFDSHEYFTETPELADRKNVKRIWKSIERFIMPKLTEIITVNSSIALLFEKEYGIKVAVIRNVPMNHKTSFHLSKKELGLPENQKIILIQGSGLNIDRGLEELTEAMVFVDNAILVILGDGDVIPLIKQKVNTLNLHEKIKFIPKQSLEKLQLFTRHADLGISIDKNTNLNYQLSLPNKIFDYIHAGIPVLCSPLVEIKSIIDKYEIGEYIGNHDPKHIADRINSILKDEAILKKYKANTLKASKELNWENEKSQLIRIFDKYAG